MLWYWCLCLHAWLFVCVHSFAGMCSKACRRSADILARASVLHARLHVGSPVKLTAGPRSRSRCRKAAGLEPQDLNTTNTQTFARQTKHSFKLTLLSIDFLRTTNEHNLQTIKETTCKRNSKQQNKSRMTDCVFILCWFSSFPSTIALLSSFYH